MLRFLTALAIAFGAGLGIGLNEGRSDLKSYLAKETLNRLYPPECHRCPKFQEHLKKLDLTETVIPTL